MEPLKSSRPLTDNDGQEASMSFLQRFLGVGRNHAYDEGIRCYDEGRFEDALRLFAGASTPTRPMMIPEFAPFYLADSPAQLPQAGVPRGPH